MNDKNILLWFGSLRTESLTTIMKFVTNLGGTLFLTCAAVLIVAIPITLRKLNSNKIKFDGFKIAAPLALASLTNSVFKHLVHRERPTIIGQLTTEHTLSFPSGHSTCSTVFYLLCAYYIFSYTKTLTDNLACRLLQAFSLLLCFMPIVIATSRLYLGVHYPTDVTAGILLGLFFVFASIKYYKNPL